MTALRLLMFVVGLGTFWGAFRVQKNPRSQEVAYGLYAVGSACVIFGVLLGLV